MTAPELRDAIIAQLPYTPNRQQQQLIAALADYCASPRLSSTVFMINGYAGTGKTSLTAALVRALEQFRVRSVLLAPTGRAAKVFGNFAHHTAYTIHRHIYRNDLNTGRFTTLKENKAKPGTVFIVDESSMLDTTDNTADSLNILDDLLQFVYSADDCRLIFLGDPAQLPPVSATPTVGLHKALKDRFFHVIRATLTNTVRQASHSGILYNATWQRKAMQQDPMPEPQIFSRQFHDVDIVTGEELVEALEQSYARYGIEDTIIITRSNRRAVDYNMAVRNVLLERDTMLAKGDIIMVAKNNYFWSTQVKGLEFIANGDMAVVERIIDKEEFAGMDFVDAELSFPDHDGITIEAKINLDCLISDSPALSKDQVSKLGMACIDNPDRYPPGTPDSVRVNGLRTDPYFNALQVKYGYAITCHKSQGGQWSSVFVDVGYIPDDAPKLDFYRWLYTATTRASEEIHFINPQSIPTD